MTTVRWITSKDLQKSAHVRDEQFPTKREALRAITMAGGAKSIVRLPNNGGRVYAVVL